MTEPSSTATSWERLEQILAQIESHGLSSLNSEDLLNLGHIYRQVVSALSTARSQGTDPAYIAYLNQLASRAYGHIYVATPRGWPSVRDFFAREFPRSFRRNLPFFAAALVIMLSGAIFAFGEVRRDPGKVDVILGPGASEMIDTIAERHTGRKEWLPSEVRPVISSFIAVNNTKVAVIAFALGILGGLLTFGILFYNGLMLGVIGAAVGMKSPSVALSFWAFVAPHGVIELTAIFIAGGAGLMLGWALLNPGDRTRRVALKLAGREAVKLLLGVMSMLTLAAVIEGFFSPSLIPNALKLGFATVVGAAVYAYLLLAGA